MELGLFVEPQVGGSYRRLVELAQWAESNGVDAFARSDHYLNQDESAHATDALTSLAAVAAETSTIRLVTLVSPITFRHPGVMAKSATTIDEISGGRFTLGVGTGWMESEHDAFGLALPPLGERFERLAEALAYIRAVFDGGGSIAGDHYSLDARVLEPSASKGLQIVIGGSGMQKTPTLAGRYADEYSMFVTDAETIEARIEVMRAAAEQAGRNPEDILISMSGPARIHGTEDEYRADVDARAEKRGMSGTEYAALLDELHVPHGTPQSAFEATERMAALGIGRYYVQEFKSLDAIDIDHLALVFNALRTN